MTPSRFRRYLGWSSPVLSLLIALSGGWRFQAWANMYVGASQRFHVNLCGADRAMLRELSRFLCRVEAPDLIQSWVMVDGRHVVSLQYRARPALIWRRPELYELTGDVWEAIREQSRLMQPRVKIQAILRRQRHARLTPPRSVT